MTDSYSLKSEVLLIFHYLVVHPSSLLLSNFTTRTLQHNMSKRLAKWKIKPHQLLCPLPPGQSSHHPRQTGEAQFAFGKSRLAVYNHLHTSTCLETLDVVTCSSINSERILWVWCLIIE